MNKFFAKVTGFLVCTAMFIGTAAGITVNSFRSANAAGGWARVTKIADLTSGGTFIFGYEANHSSTKKGIIVPMQNTGIASLTKADLMYSGTANGSSGNGTITMSSITDTSKYEVTVAASTSTSGAITIHTGVGYIGNTDTKNNCKLFSTVSATTSFTPTIDSDDVITLKINANSTYHSLQYNSGSPRFAVYGGTQSNVVAYKKITASFNVEYNLGSNIESSETKTKTGSTYTTVIQPKTGYNINTLAVSMKDSGGNYVDISSSSISDGTVAGTKNINVASVTGDLKIVATSSAKTYNVTTNLTNATSNGAATATHGSSYTATLTPAQGYVLAASDITVTMGGNPVEVTSTTINIASVTGAIVITAAGRSDTQKTFTANLTNAVWVSGNPGSSVDSQHSGNYEFVFAPATGCGNLQLSMTIDGEPVSKGISGSTIVLDPTDITGDVVVNASATANIYDVDYDLRNVTSSETKVKASHGSSFETTITPDSGKNIYLISATMNNKTDGIVISGNTITIESVTGNIEIKAIAKVSAKFVKYSGDITVGKYLVVAGEGSTAVALNNTTKSSRLQYDDVTISNNCIQTDNANIIWDVQKKGDYWTFKNAGNNEYLAFTGSKNQATTIKDGAAELAEWTVSVNDETGYDIITPHPASTALNNKYIRRNDTNGFACYVSSTGTVPTLFKLEDIRDIEKLEVSGTMSKTEYLTSDVSWDSTGLSATATFDDGSTEDVTSKVTFTFNPERPNSASITSVVPSASYTWRGVTKNATGEAQSVTVTKVDDIEVTGVTIGGKAQQDVSIAGTKYLKDEINVTAVVAYKEGTGYAPGAGKVTWISSNPDAITVTSTGDNTATIKFVGDSNEDVVITATAADLPHLTATITYKNVHLKGLSKEYPIGVEDAIAKYENYKESELFIEGYIVDWYIDKYSNSYAYIADSKEGYTNKFEIFSREPDFGTCNADEYDTGSKVLASGLYTKFSSTYEIKNISDSNVVKIYSIETEPVISIAVNEDWTEHETEYFYGDYFDPTGLVITATRENSEVDYWYDDYPDDFSFSPSLDTPLTEDTDITVTYGGKSTTISVTVTKVLDNISIKTAPTKTSYIEGQCFDPTGLVISLNYEGGAPSEDIPYLGNESKFSFSPNLTKELATTDNKVTITYEGESVDQAITVSEKSIASVAIKSFTGKSEYFAGDTLNPTGLTVTITYDNGKTEDVVYSDTTKALFTFSPETFTEAGNSVPVTVTYSGHNAGSFNVKVIPVTLEIIVVEVGTAKTEYYTGDAFDPTGLKITGINNNETEFDIDPKDCTFTGYDMSTPGQQTVTVTYQGETDTYNINVTQVVLESISLSGGKTSFEYGEAFSEGDLVVTAHYNNGDVILEEGYTITGYNPTKVGPQTITVEYQGKTKNYTVTVLPSTVIDHIIISNNASKTTFWISDTFSYQGLEISKVFTDDHKEVLSASDYIVVNPTWEVGEQEVLIKLASDVTKTVSYDIQIKALVLDHIEINTSSVTKSFEYDAEFNHNGLTVEAYYTNGVHTPITSGYTVSNPNMKQVGNQEVIVSYTEGEITKTAKYYINVKQSTVVASIGVKQEPNTVEYQIGDTFDPAGLIIEATYTDGHKAEVTGYYLSSPDMTTSGIKAITVTYKGHTTSFNITIHEEVVLARLDINTDNVKKDYLVYDIFTSEGLVVTAVYTDETEEVITNYKLQVVDMGIKGEKEIIISYGNKTNKYTINVVGRELDNISVDTSKAKVTFDYNEEFSASGLIITGEDNFNESFCIDSSVCTFSGYDKTVRGQQEITITYKGKSVTYNVFVKDSTVVDHIEITSNPSKTEYYVGDRFDPTGLVVTATYTDGRSVDIPKYLIIVEDMSIAGAKTVTISYGGQTDTCNINVTAVTLESITIDTTNAKTEYNIGDCYSNARILVMGQYSNGTTEQIDITQCTITGYDKTTAGEQTVIVNYNNKSAGYIVNVNEQ